MVCLVIAFALPLLQVPQQFSLRKADKETVATVVATTCREHGLLIRYVLNQH